jgi:serine/threonine protein kinase
MADTETVKTSIMNKSPEHDDKTIFRSLNEIVELKQREKIGGHQPSRGSKIINGFEMSRTLGKGKFGEVFLSRHRDTGFIAAIKKIEKKKVI